MKKYIVKDNTIQFRQSFPRSILCELFTTLYTLGYTIFETGSRLYPHSVNMSESEFLSVIELIKGE